MAKRLLKVRPTTMEDALKEATQVQQTERTFRLRRGEEPMQVDAVSNAENYKVPQLMKKLDQLRDIMSAFTSQLMNTMVDLQQKARVSTAQPLHGIPQGNIVPASKDPHSYQNTRQTFKWTPDGKPICSFCGIPGHRGFECRKKTHNQPLNPNAAVSYGGGN